MKKSIRIFFDSIFNERCVLESSAYASAAAQLVRAEDALSEQLEPAAKESFEAYCACRDHLEDISEAEDFELGFRISFQLMLAGLCEKSKNFTI